MPSVPARNRARLVLASSSPRRLALLRSIGLEPVVDAPDVDETPRPGESGVAAAVRLAEEKARQVAARARRSPVLAADTLVLAAGERLGKPADAREARAMLRLLSGGWHQVVTGVALALPAGRLLRGASRSRVRFATLRPAEIAAYVSGDEPYDKAGGYALQGAGGWFVEEVRGSASNVVGLPLELVRALFDEAGLPLPPLRATPRGAR